MSTKASFLIRLLPLKNPNWQGCQVQLGETKICGNLLLPLAHFTQMKPWFCLFLLGQMSLSSIFSLIFCLLFWAMGKESNYFIPNRPFIPTTILNSALFLFVTITFYAKLDLGMFVFAFPNQTTIPLYVEFLNMTYRVFHCASLCLGTLWLLDIWCSHNEIELLFNAYNKIRLTSDYYSASLGNYCNQVPELADRIKQMEQNRKGREFFIFAISLAYGLVECSLFYLIHRENGILKDEFSFLTSFRTIKSYRGILNAITSSKHTELVFICIGLCTIPYLQFRTIPAFLKYEEIFGYSKLTFEANLAFLYYLVGSTTISMVHWLGSEFISRSTSLLSPNWLFFSNQIFSCAHGIAMFIIYFVIYFGGFGKGENEGSEIKVSEQLFCYLEFRSFCCISFIILNKSSFVRE